MWWDHQNLNASRTEKTGKRWHFRVWSGFKGGRLVERIFFWDDARECTGVVMISPGEHIRRIRARIEKLVADPDIRELYKRDLKFPLERHYAEYGAFPEED